MIDDIVPDHTCNRATNRTGSVGDAPQCTAFIAAAAVLVATLVTFRAAGSSPAGGGGGKTSTIAFYDAAFAKTPSAADMTAVGRELFFDRAL